MKLFLSTLMLVGMFTAASNAEAAQCRVDLENGRGRVLETLVGYGYNRPEACQEARRQCRRLRRSGTYRAPIQRCVERRIRRNQRIVTRSCSARLTGPRGRRTIQSFLGRASGRRGSGVQAQACDRALRQCQRYKRSSRRRAARCQVDRGQTRRGSVRVGRGGFRFEIGL